jgi:hypothetical protein
MLARYYRFEQKAILGILGYPQICHDWRDEISRKLYVDRNGISLFFVQDDLLHDIESGERRKFLRRHKLRISFDRRFDLLPEDPYLI